MTKNDKCLNDLIKLSRKLRNTTNTIIYKYEKDQFVKPIPAIYGIVNGLDILFNILVTVINEKLDDKKEERESVEEI